MPAKADGAFDQSALPPGRYTYFARALDAIAAASKATAPTLWASLDLDVNGRDVPDLVIHLQQGINVAGRLTADAGRTAPDWSAVHISLEPIDDGPHLTIAPAQVAADGTFVVRGVTPGTYDLAVTGITHWTGKRVVAGGADLIDSGVVVSAGEDVADLAVTMTDQAPSIEGRLADGGGRPGA